MKISYWQYKLYTAHATCYSNTMVDEAKNSENTVRIFCEMYHGCVSQV